ncbi:CAP domain-containing protein [Oceanobacillus massiliensis]|uniref:CAP domain-containing protein n=1 Tax=Oceanobacillus massiliensis TaxID=1465765 RepID=UPI000289FCDD|nr:CAP domain-containing protein [Oceanobacillus massiliensis]
MPKLRHIIVIIILAGALWHFYGETFQQHGAAGVYEEIRSDANALIENPHITAAIDTINQEFQLLKGRLTDIQQESQQKKENAVERPQLDEPTEQSFSVGNAEIGDDRSEVENLAGKPKRSTMNEYGTDWHTYHENYHNFFMVAYDDQDQVAGIYTNQDMLTSTKGISYESSRESVLAELGEPLKAIRKGLVNYQIQNEQEYDVFLIENNYVTIFYDKHENNTVTAIQIISGELEKQKTSYFADPDQSLKEGFEYQLFDLTNAARVNHGLTVLNWEEPLRKTARDHSTDMAVNHYFSHTNPEGQSPFDRMAEDAISFRIAGENLAAGQSSSIFAHEGLMNSLGHRENKLKKEYEALAVGVSFDNESKPFFTENYLTK